MTINYWKALHRITFNNSIEVFVCDWTFWRPNSDTTNVFNCLRQCFSLDRTLFIGIISSFRYVRKQQTMPLRVLPFSFWSLYRSIYSLRPHLLWINDTHKKKNAFSGLKMLHCRKKRFFFVVVIILYDPIFFKKR